MSIDLLDYQVMAFDTGKFLSFVIRTNGEIVPTMPDDEEFSASQIGAYVAGTPEVVGETHDGFLLFQSKEGTERGSPVNELNVDVWRNWRTRRQSCRQNLSRASRTRGPILDSQQEISSNRVWAMAAPR